MTQYNIGGHIQSGYFGLDRARPGLELSGQKGYACMYRAEREQIERDTLGRYGTGGITRMGRFRAGRDS